MHHEQTLLTINQPQIHHHSWRGYLFAVSLSVCLFIGGVAAMNLYVDPYDIFNPSEISDNPFSNDRHNKIEHIIGHSQDYNGLIIGSSRMGVFDPQVAGTLRSISYYNLSLLGSEPRETLAILKYLHKLHMPLREVLLGIDFYPFAYTGDFNDYTRKMHPAVNGRNQYAYYGQYLFAPSFYHSALKTMRRHVATSDTYQMDYGGTGMFMFPGQEAAILKHPEKYRRQHFQGKEVDAVQYTLREDTFADFKQLIHWLKDNGIDAYLFIHPFYQGLRKQIPDPIYNGWRSRIFKITGPIPDYSDRADMIDDSFNYYDFKHYRPVIARMIMEGIWSAPEVALPLVRLKDARG